MYMYWFDIEIRESKAAEDKVCYLQNIVISRWFNLKAHTQPCQKVLCFVNFLLLLSVQVKETVCGIVLLCNCIVNSLLSVKSKQFTARVTDPCTNEISKHTGFDSEVLKHYVS